MPRSDSGRAHPGDTADRRQPHLIPIVGLALLASIAGGAGADDGAVERLQAENARLQARVRELEAENAALRGRVGSVEEKAERSVTTSVDEGRNRTSLDMEPSRLELTGGNRSRHWISLHAERGSGAPGNDAEIGIEAAASNGIYRRAQRLELSLDGTPLSLPVTSRTAAPILSGPQAQRVGERETVRIAVSTDAVARIGAAREVTGRLGPTTFVLNPEQIASFAAVARRLASPEPERRSGAPNS
jgi:hypothetical protein